MTLASSKPISHLIGDAMSAEQTNTHQDDIAMLLAALNKADQQLSGIQHYSTCKTARDEAALIRCDLRVALNSVQS